jgi:hypothetical protein
VLSGRQECVRQPPAAVAFRIFSAPKSKLSDIRQLLPIRHVRLENVKLKSPPEKRNVTRREALVQRVCGEFEEMRGLSLTLPQAARLFALPQDACQRVFASLIEERVISLRNGQYVRRLTFRP